MEIKFEPNRLYYCHPVWQSSLKHVCLGKNIMPNPFSVYPLVIGACGKIFVVTIPDQVNRDLIICEECINFWKTYDLINT